MPTHYRGAEKAVRALNAYIPLVRATESVLGRLAGRLAGEGLTVGQFGALEALLHLGPMCQRKLAEKQLRTEGNLTMVIDHLETRGLVRRDRDRDDRRRIQVRLTPRGARLIRRIFPAHVRAIVAELSPLSPAEQRTLRSLCRKLGRAQENKGANHDLRSQK